MFTKSRRWAILAGLALLVSSVGVSTVWSYVKTAHTILGERIRDSVSIEFDVKRLDTKVEEVLPEIRTNQKVAAQLEVEIEYLEAGMNTLRDSQEDAKAQMQKMRKVLDEPSDSFQFGGRNFTRQQVEDDLTRRLQAYESSEQQLAAKEKLLDTRRQTLAAATDKIREYEHQRVLLVQKSESLRAELKLLELTQATGNFEFDQSKLAATKQLAEDVEKRIRTMQKLVDGERNVAGEIPVDADSRSAKERFDEYFASKK